MSAERQLLNFQAPFFPSVVDAVMWWSANRVDQSERVQRVGDLMLQAHELYRDGKREQAADAYDVAADAAEEISWSKGLGDEARQSAWWCRTPSVTPRSVAIACEHGYDHCPRCDASVRSGDVEGERR